MVHNLPVLPRRSFRILKSEPHPVHGQSYWMVRWVGHPGAPHSPEERQAFIQADIWAGRQNAKDALKRFRALPPEYQDRIREFADAIREVTGN